MLLAVKDLTITYGASGRPVQAVRHVSLSVESGKTLGVVGATGSGKSSVGMAMIRLLPPGTVVTGQVMLGDQDILTLSESQMRRLRGKSIGMVFQDSLAALNPVLPVYAQLTETIKRHEPGLTKTEVRKRADDAFDELAIPRARFRSYPHEFSGGMRQRAMIAIALAPKPAFLIADEATSELDAPNQRLILDILAEIQRSRGLGLIVVSHDLAVVGHLCEEVAVIYRGDLVEYGPTKQVLEAPTAAYTQALMRISAKTLDEHGRLYTLPRVAARPAEPPAGVQG